jgi:hypothetical protein
MALPQRQPASYQDLIGLPESWAGEIIDGELYAQPFDAISFGLSVLWTD